MKKKAKKKFKTAKEAGVYDPKAASKDAMVRISAKRLVELASKKTVSRLDKMFEHFKYKNGYKEGWNAAFDDIVSRCPLPNCFDCKDLKALKIKE